MEERDAKLQEQVSQLANERQQSGILVALQRQSDAIEALHEKVDHLAQHLDAISNRVSEIEKEPGERWKKISFEIIKYIVLAAVGAAVGYFMK